MIGLRTAFPGPRTRASRHRSPAPDGTDTAIVRDGYATVSLLTPPAAIDDLSVLGAFEAFDEVG